MSHLPILLPSDPRFGPPDGVWLDDLGRVTLVWTARPGVPTASESSDGLVVTAMPGSMNPDYFEKIIHPGGTVEPVEVNGGTGYWISGSPHEFVYVDPAGQARFDPPADRRHARLVRQRGHVPHRDRSRPERRDRARGRDALRARRGTHPAGPV